MHASYKEAIDWIARNDEESEMNPDYIADSLTVQLVADLWRKAADAVAMDVYKARVRIVAVREQNRRNEEIAIAERREIARHEGNGW